MLCCLVIICKDGVIGDDICFFVVNIKFYVCLVYDYVFDWLEIGSLE